MLSASVPRTSPSAGPDRHPWPLRVDPWGVEASKSKKEGYGD